MAVAIWCAQYAKINLTSMDILAPRVPQPPGATLSDDGALMHVKHAMGSAERVVEVPCATKADGNVIGVLGLENAKHRKTQDVG